jgi:hypothetical protein
VDGLGRDDGALSSWPLGPAKRGPEVVTGNERTGGAIEGRCPLLEVVWFFFPEAEQDRDAPCSSGLLTFRPKGGWGVGDESLIERF